MPPLKWVSDPSTSIIFPVVEFGLAQVGSKSVKTRNDIPFPFPIKEIVLGPNMAEQETNQAEIELMSKDKLGTMLKVGASKISSFRV